MKNVICIIVDSLRYDRLGFAGHAPDPSPTINRLMSSGLAFKNCFAVGCPTDFSYPGLFTSTLPLDRGGYTLGISNRKKNLAEVFRDAGYRTAFFVQDAWPSNWGYTRGSDDIYPLYDLARFKTEVLGSQKFYNNLWKANPAGKREYVARFQTYLSGFFEDLRSYCTRMTTPSSEPAILRSLMLHDHDFNAMLKMVHEAESEFRADPERTALRFLEASDDPFYTQLASLVAARTDNPHTIDVDRPLRALLILVLLHLTMQVALDKASVIVTLKCMQRLLKKQSKSVWYSSAGYMFNNLFSWLDGVGDRRFFAWIHTADVHELNFTSYDIPGAGSIVADEIREAKKLYSGMTSRLASYRGNPMYDFSIRYTDAQIARLLEYLKQRDLLKDTLILITADHGHFHAGWPVRNKVHVTSHFYDDLYHVPLVFAGDGVPARVFDGLCSSLDVGPTLLDLVGLPAPECFQGTPLNRKDSVGRTHVLMEHMGSGFCDFQAKPIGICVRSSQWKLVYVMPPPAAPGKGFVRELYDLQNDPWEQKNLAGDGDPPSQTMELLQTARQRVRQIYEQNNLPWRD